VLGWLSLAAGAVCLALGIGRFMAVKSMIAREFDSRDGSTPTERRGAA
jgi:hypothetical protein